MDIEETQSFQPLAVDQQHQPTKIRNPPEVLVQDRDRGVAQPSHVCDICHKGFYSGQALGGHKSMHFREAEAMAAMTTSTSDTVSCVVCGKNFPSKKSLFGHMRTHKGNQSPQQDYNRSSSSSTVSAVPVADEECDEVYSWADSGSGFDLSKTLPSGWPPTGKRSRASIGSSSSDSDETVDNSKPKLVDSGLDSGPKEQLKGLMMLAEVCEEMANARNFITKRKKGWSAADHYDYNELDCDFRCKPCNKTFPSYQALGGHMSSHNKLKIVSMDHGHVSEGNSEPHQVVNVYRCSVCSRTFSSYQALGGHMSSHCKEVKNSDNYSADHVDNEPDQPQLHQVDVHRCYVCNKAFTSYHALGGHMSSHAKIKNNNDSDRDQSNSADMSACAVDNNERRQQFYETVPHQCKTCNRTFPTGQALGGHMRLHWNGPNEAQAQRIPPSSGPRVLGFNLNEIPTMEDEEGIYAPNVLLQLN